jgi:hypothetical protein
MTDVSTRVTRIVEIDTDVAVTREVLEYALKTALGQSSRQQAERQRFLKNVVVEVRVQPYEER